MFYDTSSESSRITSDITEVEFHDPLSPSLIFSASNNQELLPLDDAERINAVPNELLSAEWIDDWDTQLPPAAETATGAADGQRLPTKEGKVANETGKPAKKRRR